MTAARRRRAAFMSDGITIHYLFPPILCGIFHN